MAIKHNERRIGEMEKSSSFGSGILPNNSGIEDSSVLQSSEIYNTFFSKYDTDWQESIRKLKEDISRTREQVQGCVRPY